MVEDVPLLGVEFLTPGLARKKWLALVPPSTPAIGRELLLLQLRTLIARRLRHRESAGGPPTLVDGTSSVDSEWGFWMSLASDAESALDDFDELLGAGFSEEDFPLPMLRDLFRELARWVDTCGYTFAALQAVRSARPPETASELVAGRVLVCGLGPEMWCEFFNVAAFVRRSVDVTVVLPEPEFEGTGQQSESWIELWSQLLGANPLPLDAADPVESCEGVAMVWSQPAGHPVPAQLIVGKTRADEMQCVAEEIARLLARGADNVAVIFPRADPAHLTLARLLQEWTIAFADLLETAGPPPIEVQAQRALLAYIERGGRIEEFLALWPLLRALGTVKSTLADARRACERSFDSRQTHDLQPHITEWKSRAPELAHVASLCGESWPSEVSLMDGLARFRAMCGRLEIDAPDTWGPLDTIAAIDREAKPLAIVTAALSSFLPEGSTVTDAPGRNTFARVTLTTRRRAEGLAWSHVILVEANAGVWPQRQEPSCWLTDECRASLNGSGRCPPSLFTTDERASLERKGYAAICRDTREAVIFSASLSDEKDPEVKLAPNSWVERFMWANGLAGPGGDVEGEFVRSATAMASPAGVNSALDAWHDVWRSRRDPRRPFDDFFFAGDPSRITPDKLPAKLIERGVQDPAELWFEAVLRTRRTPWDPFVRARRKALGQWAHQLLASAFTPSETRRGFGEMPGLDDARRKLADTLQLQRTAWPANRYWDSFHAELSHLCVALLENVYTIEAGPFVATEAWLPREAHLQLGAQKIPISGRLDLVRLDQPAWSGARVDIMDFKTGGDLELSAERMARTGASLQLGIYLDAARSLGVSSGRVWMIKPEPGAVAQLSFADMAVGLAKLRWLEQALARGVYGALTRDRSDYAPDGCQWPLACTPIPRAVLEQKFEVTFGVTPEIAIDE